MPLITLHQLIGDCSGQLVTRVSIRVRVMAREGVLFGMWNSESVFCRISIAKKVCGIKCILWN